MNSDLLFLQNNNLKYTACLTLEELTSLDILIIVYLTFSPALNQTEAIQQIKNF